MELAGNDSFQITLDPQTDSDVGNADLAYPAGSGPIRVAYIVDAIHVEQAGTEGHLLRLARQLDRSRCQPFLVVLQDTPWARAFDDSRVPLHVLGFRSFLRVSDWRLIGTLSRWLREHRIDVVELHAVDSHFLGAIAARRAGTPVVISCRRDMGHQHALKALCMMRLVNPWIDRFLANSWQVVKTSAAREGVSEDQFDVIYNGVDLETFDASADCHIDPAVAELCGQHPTIVVLANLRAVKNIPGFLHAARRVVKAVPEARMLMLGDGPDAAKLHDLATRLGLENHVTWMGSVEAPANYLRHASIGCLPSHAEGFSNAIVEYMAAGLPVVATQVGGAAEAIVDGETGYLVPADNSEALASRLIELLRDPPLRERMGDRGRRRIASRFLQKHKLQEYAEYYSRLLKTSKR